MSNLAIIFLLSFSAFFFFIGTLGIIRLPDIITRLHATTKCDTLGAGLAILALMIHYGISIISIKFLIILILIWITAPTVAHTIGNSIYQITKGKV